jgi:WD40 repeat protein
MEILGTLGYSGEHIEIISPDTLCYRSGNGLCMIDTIKGPKDILWRTEKGISCWSSHQETNQIVIAPNIDGGHLSLYSLTTSQITGTLPNPVGGKIIYFSFSGDGTYLLALSDSTDHKVMMWNTQSSQLLFVLDLFQNLKCEKCLMHPVDNTLFLLYGSEAILSCQIIEILGSYDVKFNQLQMKIDSKYPLTAAAAAAAGTDDDTEYYQGISCAIWSPPSSLLVGTYDGAIYFIEPTTKYSKKLFSLPSKSTEKMEAIQPIALFLNGTNLIIGTGKCLVYWYTMDPLDLTVDVLENESHFQEIFSGPPEQIVTLEMETDLITSSEMALAGEGHFLTCLLCDTSDYSSCIASTSDGMIYKFSSEIQQLTNDDDDDDGGGHDSHQSKHKAQKPVILSHLPLYTLHSGTVISSHSMSIPISEYASSNGALASKNEGAVMTFDHAESVTVFITGAYSGAVSFWRILNPNENTAAPVVPTTSASTTVPAAKASSIMGITRSLPRIPQRLCRRYVCDKVEVDQDVNVVPHVITAFETLSLATYGGGRLLAVGTLTGWFEVWRVEAYLSDDTSPNHQDEQELDENALNEEDLLRDIKVGVQLIYRKRFYDTAITSISSSDVMSCVAISSYHSPLIYAINTSPKNKFQEIKVYTLGDQSNQPVSLSWTGPLLWVPTHEGIFFTFLPEMNQDDGSASVADGAEDEEGEELRITPALVDLTPIHPKVMWDIESRPVLHALPISGSGGGCIFTKQDVPMVGLIDNYPTVFDLEHNNLLHSESTHSSDEVPEVPMLQMPGNVRLSIPMSSAIISIAKAPASSLVATGTYEGSIFIWRIKRGEITLLNRYQPHSCAVVNLLFTIDSSQVISCGVDGTIFITLIDKPIQPTSNVLSLLLENDLYDMKHREGGSVSSKKILWKDHHHQEVMNQLKETFKSKSIHFQSIVENIENRLKTLLVRNHDANELEKMELTEFVIDVKRKEAMVEQNRVKAEKIKEMYQLKSSMNELVAARIKEQCWDTMEVHSLTIFPMQQSSPPAPTQVGQGQGQAPHSTKTLTALSSFSIEKLTNSESLKLQRVKKLRIIEITSQRQTLQQKGSTGGRIDMVGGGNWRCCWGKNIHGTPNVITWLFNDGLRWPCQDMIKLILDQEKSNNTKEAASSEGAAAGAVTGGGGTATEKNKSNNKSSLEKSSSMPLSAAATIATPVAIPTRLDDDDEGFNTGDLITGEQEINFNNIFNLLYAPQTVRTHVQKCNQIIFLKEIIRLIKSNFNKYFDKIYHEKEDAMMSIQAKNLRIQEIMTELHLSSEEISSLSTGASVGGSALTPQWHDMEKIDSAIHVTDEEVNSRPYETNAMRAQRLVDEEKKRMEELERNSDGKERALQDMMNGTLEVKRDVLSEAAAALQKPLWMVEYEEKEGVVINGTTTTISSTGSVVSTSVLLHYEHLTEIQKKDYDEYQGRYQLIQDEQMKYYKSLELEMKKLRVEIQDVMRGFDEKLQQMTRLKILVQREILSHELYITRLALSMVKREQCWIMLKDVEKEIEMNHKRREEINRKIDQLTQVTEEAKVQLTNFQDEEKVLDRSFKRDLQTMCNMTFDQDLLKLFTQLYRLRKYQETGDDISHGDDEEDPDHAISTAEGRSSRNSLRRRLSLKRSLGNSKGQSKGVGGGAGAVNHRRSKGNSVSNRAGGGGGVNGGGSEALGPLQTAAKEMLEQEAGNGNLYNKQLLNNAINQKNPFSHHLLSQDREKRIQASQIPLLQPLNIDLDTPEGFSTDPFVWSKLQELRLHRITKEISVKGQLKTYTELKKKLDLLIIEEDHIHQQAVTLRQSRDNIFIRLNELMTDLDVLITVRQGQDEVDSDVIVTDYNSSKLIPTLVIEKYNTKIKELGSEKINILIKIKQFRRKMNLVDWEARHLQLEGWHLEEYYTDSQLFRVTRDLQKIIKDGINFEQNKSKQEKVLIRKEFMKKDNENKMMKMRQLIEMMRGQIEERRVENGKYQNKIVTLKGEVAVREQVVRASTAGGGGGGGGTRGGVGTAPMTMGGGTGGGGTRGGVEMSKTNPLNTMRADQKMKKIVKRRKLVDTARIQAEEIDYLKQELDKLRQKTFPSFVKATRNRLVYNPDERV